MRQRSQTYSHLFTSLTRHTSWFFTITYGVLVLLVTVPLLGHAQVMQSSNFQLESDSLNIGGARSVSASFGLEDSVGQNVSGEAASASFSQNSGFQQSGDDQIVVVDNDDAGASVASRADVDLLSALSVVPLSNRAYIAFETAQPTTFVLRYGAEGGEELGVVTHRELRSQHYVVIEALEPGNAYWFMLSLETEGGASMFHEGTFTTFSGSGSVSRLNVSDFVARFSSEDTDNVLLSWQNPFAPEVAEIIIVYRPDFYATSPTEGEIIYRGRTQSFVHELDSIVSAAHYYTAFVTFTDGTYSSGAMTFLLAQQTGESDVMVDPVIGPATDAGITETAPFSFQTILFEQNGQVLQNQVASEVTIRADLPLRIRVPYDAVPEVLKTLVFAMDRIDEAGATSTFSFLLRVNEDKSFYEANIAPLRSNATYPSSLTLFNFETQTLSRTEGVVRAIVGDAEVSTDADTKNSYVYAFLLLFALITFWWLMVLKRRQKETQNI